MCFLISFFFSVQVLHPLLMVIGFILISGEGSGLKPKNWNFELKKIKLLNFMQWVLIGFGFLVVFSNSGTQMVTWFKEFEEISSFGSSRGSFSLWNIWNLD